MKQFLVLAALGTTVFSILLIGCGSSDQRQSTGAVGGSGQTSDVGGTAGTNATGNTGGTGGTNATNSANLQVDDVITLAGDFGSSTQDSDDGPGQLGLLNEPDDIVSDGAHIYVLEGSPSHRVRVLDRATGIVSTLAGTGANGYKDGPGSSAQFSDPEGFTIDPSHQNLYVADTGNSVIRKIVIATGEASTIAGLANGDAYADGIGAQARFYTPWAVAIDSKGQNLYVTDTSNDAIRVINLASNEVSTLAGTTKGSSDGVGTAASFTGPKGITIDSADAKLYVADANDTIRVVDIASRQVTTLATTINRIDGFESTAGIINLWSVAVDPTSTFLYTTEGAGERYLVRQIELATGIVTMIGGTKTSSGYLDSTVGTQAQFDDPLGLRVIDQAVYVADSANNAIRTLAIGTHAVSTYAGGPHPANFLQPFGITNDGQYLYVTDSGSNSMIRKVSMTSGYTTTIAGEPLMAHDDGIGANAHFNVPMGIVLGGSHLYIADADNHEIRALDLANNQVTTLAGSFEQTGATDGIGSAATFDTPAGVTIDRAGQTLYVTDRGNHEIRQVDIASGQVTTFAGSTTSGFSDGVGAAAAFNIPADLLMDPSGATLYVADSGNNAIRKVDVATGAVSTFAGSGVAGSIDGIGTAASFMMPLGLATDGTWLYVADSKNNEIRKVELASARVTTVYGSLAAGTNDGTGVHAGFSMPIGLSLDATASVLYVCDSRNETIRKIRLK